MICLEHKFNYKPDECKQCDFLIFREATHDFDDRVRRFLDIDNEYNSERIILKAHTSSLELIGKAMQCAAKLHQIGELYAFSIHVEGTNDTDVIDHLEGLFSFMVADAYEKLKEII